MFSAVFFSRGLVNLWYGGKKKLKSLAVGQVWRPATATAGGAPAYLEDEPSGDDAVATPARSANLPAPASAAKRKASAKAPAGAQTNAGKPTVRRRNAPGTPTAGNAPKKPGSTR
jgi:preprotein translocase subunit SecD